VSQREIDRAAARQFVEDFWRTLMLAGRDLARRYPTMTRECEAVWREEAHELHVGFERQRDFIADLMSPERAALFLRMVDEEDETCFNEEQSNPVAFYRRLGIDETYGSRRPIASSAYQGRGLGNLAVRTAVRATVWESIYSVFRMFRR
jgi:hypothetical protein